MHSTALLLMTCDWHWVVLYPQTLQSSGLIKCFNLGCSLHSYSNCSKYLQGLKQERGCLCPSDLITHLIDVKDSLSYCSFSLSLIMFHCCFTPFNLSLFRQVWCGGFNQLELIWIVCACVCMCVWVFGRFLLKSHCIWNTLCHKGGRDACWMPCLSSL